MESLVVAPFLVHLVFWTLALGVCVAAYLYAVSTRKRITCRSCGERVQTEHDTIASCPSCGAPLR